MGLSKLISAMTAVFCGLEFSAASPIQPSHQTSPNPSYGIFVPRDAASLERRVTCIPAYPLACPQYNVCCGSGYSCCSVGACCAPGYECYAGGCYPGVVYTLTSTYTVWMTSTVGSTSVFTSFATTYYTTTSYTTTTITSKNGVATSIIYSTVTTGAANKRAPNLAVSTSSPAQTSAVQALQPTDAPYLAGFSPGKNLVQRALEGVGLVEKRASTFYIIYTVTYTTYRTSLFASTSYSYVTSTYSITSTQTFVEFVGASTTSTITSTITVPPPGDDSSQQTSPPQTDGGVTHQQTSSGLSKAAKIGIGVGAGIGGLLLLIALAFLIRACCVGSSHPPPPPPRPSSSDDEDEKHGGHSDFQYRPIPIPAVVGTSMDRTLHDLDAYRQSFLDQAEHAVRRLIHGMRKRDITAIDQVGPDGSRVKWTMSDKKAWVKRFWTLSRYKPSPGQDSDKEKESLPPWGTDGSALDSHMSQPIISEIRDIYAGFIRDHGDIVAGYLVHHLNVNPAVQKEFARQFAKAMRESAEPLTEEVYKALVHLISTQLSGQVATQLGTQVAHAMGHAGAPAMAAFAAKLAGLLSKFVGKYLAKGALLGAAKKFAVKKAGVMAVTAIIPALANFFAMHLGHHAVGHSAGAGAAVAGIVAWPVTVGIITFLVIVQISGFKKEVADKVAPAVRQSLDGSYEAWNRSALEQIARDTFKDGGWQVCKLMLEESELGEMAKGAGEEVWTAAKREGGTLLRDVQSELVY